MVIAANPATINATRISVKITVNIGFEEWGESLLTWAPVLGKGNMWISGLRALAIELRLCFGRGGWIRINITSLTWITDFRGPKTLN